MNAASHPGVLVNNWLPHSFSEGSGMLAQNGNLGLALGESFPEKQFCDLSSDNLSVFSKASLTVEREAKNFWSPSVQLP